MFGLTVTVYLSLVGLGLVALPAAAVQAIATRGPVGALSAVDGGAQSQGYYLSARLAAPMVVNLGNLNVSWSGSRTSSDTQNYLGVRLGTLNTTAPINCPGSGVVLQLDAQQGDYSAKISRIGGDSSTLATRVEYTCTVAPGAAAVPGGPR